MLHSSGMGFHVRAIL